MIDSNVTETAKIFMDIFDVYDANILKINTILKNGFCDVAIITTISALEVLLTDLLEAYKDFWFRSRAGGNINAVFLENIVRHSCFFLSTCIRTPSLRFLSYSSSVKTVEHF